MLTSTAAFIRYFDGVRDRTLNFIAPIPPEQIDFAPHPGKFSLGDLIRHIAATETMFVGVVLDGRWVYSGHSRELGASKDAAVAFLATAHASAMNRLRELPDAALNEKRPTLDGHAVSVWRILMLMAEHEVHHRSQISQYLVDLGIEPPQVFGKRMEELPTN